MQLGNTYLLYFNTSRWSNLDQGFVKQGLRIALLTKHLKVWIEKSPSGDHSKTNHHQNQMFDHHLKNHHDAVVDDGLQAEHRSLVDVNQVDLLARLAVPRRGSGLGWFFKTLMDVLLCLIVPE